MKTTSEPLVTVILPVYNGEKFLNQAIDSVLEQTYANLELIIINDGSTDDTARIINNYTDTRIKSILQNNAGPSAARNRGIEEAKGEFIAFIDADDTYLPIKIDEQINFLKKTKACATYCDVQIINHLHQKITTIKSEGRYFNKEDFHASLLFRQIIPNPVALMLRRCCFDEGLRYDETYVQSEDYKFTIDLAKDYLILYHPTTLYSYRRHTENLSNKHSYHQNNEIKILKPLGIDTIINIVNGSTFSSNMKKFLLAKILYKLGEYNHSIKLLESIANTNSEALFYIGNIQYHTGNFLKAKVNFEWAIAERTQRAELINNLGCCLAKLGKLTQARDSFNTALVCKPNYMDPAKNLRKLATGQKDYNLTSIELRRELIPYYP